MPDLLERLGASLRARPGALAPLDGAPARAAVLTVLRTDRGEPELLLIERAAREGDPWSGQVALPGGRWQVEDQTLEHTAARETLEETGLDVWQGGAILGALDELRPRTALLPSIVVTPFVAHLPAPPALQTNHEVAAAFWVPWSQLIDPAVDRISEVRARGSTWRAPSFVLGDRVVWGMTERILRDLIARIQGETL